METKTIDIADFSQTSSFSSYFNTSGTIVYSTPTIVYATKYFSLAGIPSGASLISATLRITRNSPIYGFTQWKYRIESSDWDDWVNLARTTRTDYNNVKTKLQAAFDANDRNIKFEFKYQCKTATKTTTGTWYSWLNYSNVQLVVEYELPYSACTPPSSASVSPSVSEGDATLTFSGAAGGTSNDITGYEVQYAESLNGSTWGSWNALKVVSSGSGSGSFGVAPSGTRATYRKYQMRTRGAAGADYYSTWKAVSNTVRRNSAPAVPVVTGPSANSTIYNSTPRILATVGADTDGNAQAVTASGYTPSSAGNQAVGKKLVLRRTSAYTEGAQSVSVSSTDIFGIGSGVVSRSFTYTAPSWTDATLTGGATKIKAAHINELRTAVNNIRAYYGLAAKAWAETITAGSTGLAGWKDHVLEMRSAIDDIVSLVNGWDTASSTHNIPAISWLAIPTNTPSKAVIDQLRAVIPTL